MEREGERLDLELLKDLCRAVTAVWGFSCWLGKNRLHSGQIQTCTLMSDFMASTPIMSGKQ